MGEGVSQWRAFGALLVTSAIALLLAVLASSASVRRGGWLAAAPVQLEGEASPEQGNAYPWPMRSSRWWREEGTAGESDDGRYQAIAYLPHLRDEGLGVPENGVQGGNEGRGRNAAAMAWLVDYNHAGGDPWTKGSEKRGGDSPTWHQREWQKVLRSLSSSEVYERPFYASASKILSLPPLPRDVSRYLAAPLRPGVIKSDFFTQWGGRGRDGDDSGAGRGVEAHVNASESQHLTFEEKVERDQKAMARGTLGQSGGAVSEAFERKVAEDVRHRRKLSGNKNEWWPYCHNNEGGCDEPLSVWMQRKDDVPHHGGHPDYETGWGSSKKGAIARVQHKALLLDECFGGLHSGGGNSAACDELRDAGNARKYMISGGYALLKKALMPPPKAKVHPKEGLDW